MNTHRLRATVGGLCLATAVSGCASAGSSPAAPATVTVTASQTAPATSQAPTSQPASPTPPPGQVVVPNGVGKDYQSAQDLWRAAGLHVAPAIDATGAHRLPIIDSNWVVLSQSLTAGTSVPSGTFITATVKKYTDS